MNAEFVEKMLQAKRLEAEAIALLLPEGARRLAAGVVRAGAAAALAVLDDAAPAARPGEAGGDSGAAARTGARRGVQPIVIE